jgi:hypothetical protein
MHLVAIQRGWYRAISMSCVTLPKCAGTEPWKFYDLGHGYCTYDFFEQCQHRMACAKCDFYMPKQSTAALLLEGKEHLLWLLQEIPLGEAEQGPSKTVSQPTNISCRNWPTCPLRQGQRRMRSAQDWCKSLRSER